MPRVYMHTSMDMCRCACVHLCMSWDCGREAYVYMRACVSSRHMQFMSVSICLHLHKDTLFETLGD